MPQGTERSYASLAWALCVSEPGDAGSQAKHVYRDVPNHGWKRLIGTRGGGRRWRVVHRWP